MNTDSSRQRRSLRSQGRGGGATSRDARGLLTTPVLLGSGTCPLRSRQAEGAWPAASATNVGTDQLRRGTGGCPGLGSPWLDACRGQNGNAGCGCEGTRACGGSALGRPRQPCRGRRSAKTKANIWHRNEALAFGASKRNGPPALSHTAHTRVHTDNTRRDWVGSSSAPPCLFPCPSRQSRESTKPISKPPSPGRGGACRSSGRALRVPSEVSLSARGGGGPGVASTAQLHLSLFPSLGPQREARKARHWVTRLGRK